MITDEALRKLEKYMVKPATVTIDIPPSLATTVAKYVGNKPSRIRRVIENGRSKLALRATLAMRNKATFVAKPKNIVPREGYFELIFPNDFKLRVTREMLKRIGKTVSDVISALSDWWLVKVEREEGTVVAKKAVALRAKVDYETARAISEEVDIPLAEVLTLGLGIKPEAIEKLNLLYTIRWAVVISRGDYTLHVIQLTNAGTGKTTFGVRLVTLCNAEIISEVPTPARLVYDARTGYGAVVLSDMIVFDEIDKWEDKAKMRAIVSVLNTGLENGIWTRGASSLESVDIIKRIPTLWFGNSSPLATSIRPREYIRMTAKQMWGINPEQFEQRFTVIDVWYSAPNIATAFRPLILTDAVIRGLIELARRRLRPLEDYDTTLEGRYAKHSQRLQALFDVLEYYKGSGEVETQMFDAIIMGAVRFEELQFKKISVEEALSKLVEVKNSVFR